MAITNEDIVLFQSQDNTDNDNGGGRRTSAVVVDGAVNNLFPDISRIDTTSGDVALRKVFPVVNTDDREIYFGAHAIIRKPPTDPNVSALLFYTDSPSDVRSEARDDIEAYLSPSFEAPFYLFGNNINGSRAITVLQRESEQLPIVGDVYLIQEGSTVQYIRIRDINPTIVTLSFNSTDYTRRRVVLTLEQPLGFDFNGSSFHPDGQRSNTATMFTTQVSNAARFYGTRTLETDAPEGALTIQLDSIFEQLVPAATTQSAIINADALQQGELLLTSNDIVTIDISQNNVVVGHTLPTPISPNSFSFASSTDDGNGNLINSQGVIVGSINYQAGTFIKTDNTNGGTVNYESATVVNSEVQFTDFIPITQENQGAVYIRNVAPVPTGRDIYIDYRSGGRWTRLVGNSDGTIGSDPRAGAGLVSDNGDGTATISVTLGANPDLDSTVIFSWGSSDYLLESVAEANSSVESFLQIQLEHELIDPASTMFSYVDNFDTTHTFDFSTGLQVSVDNANITATLNPTIGLIRLTRTVGETGTLQLPSFTELASSNDNVTLTYNYADEPATSGEGRVIAISNPSFSSNNVTGQHSFNLNTNIVRSSIVVRLLVTPRNDDGFNLDSETIVLIADNQGNLRLSPTGFIFGTVSANGLIQITMPTIRKRDYVTITRNDGTTYQLYTFVDRPRFLVRSASQVEYQTDAVSNYVNSFSQTYIARDITRYITRTVGGIVGGITFLHSGDQYFTRDSNVFSIAGQQVGSIDNLSGVIELDPSLITLANDAFDFQFTSITADNLSGNNGVTRVSFRTSATDLTTSSFVLRYETTLGSFVATSDSAGVITGTDIDSSRSNVDTVTGAVTVFFNNSVNSTTLRYDAVAETTLPLNPELLGLDPVRLPPNGRVPVFDEGRHLVIFQEETTDIVGIPAAGQTITLDRQDQAYIEVIDVNGQRLDYAQYTADRTAGTLTFANPLSLVDRAGEALTAPYHVVDRVEDMVLATSVEITGRVGISAPLTRDYPADTTRVASALVWGDIGSRVFNIFSQQSFDGWSDQQTTGTIPAQYDDVNFPIQINNADSFSGRWAAVFVSNTSVRIQEESLGVVVPVANITNEIAPVNPATGNPYFTIPADGWGSGWLTSNVLRFNTESGAENMWIIRTVQSGALTEDVDSIDIEIRGDAN